jgi:SAM-dependent methyltransferase
VADESRAVIFGRDAATYDAVRPDYPPEAIARVEGLVEAKRALEVGAGTGKATVALAREGLDLTCLEPSPQMAAVLESRRLPGVSVETTTFEEWQGEPASMDLVYAAQAWHWVERDTGFEKALSVLRPGGALALLWNVPLDRYLRHHDLYVRHAPHLLAESDERIKRRDDHDWGADMAAAGFVDTEKFTHRWSEELTSERYRALYSTYSDHMMLDESVRTRLLDGLAADVESWGGVVEVEYRTEVFSGRRPVPGRR